MQKFLPTLQPLILHYIMAFMEHFAYFALTSNLNQCSETCQLFVPSLKSGIVIVNRNLLIKILRFGGRRSEQSRSQESAKRNLQCPLSLLFCLFLSFLLAPLTKKAMIPLPSPRQKTICTGPIGDLKVQCSSSP